MIATAATYSHLTAALIDLPNIEIENDSDGNPKHVLKLDFSELVQRIQNHGPIPRTVEGVAYGRRNWVTIPKQHYLERGVGLQVKRTPKDCDPMVHADAVVYALNRFRVVCFVGSDRDIEPFLPILRMQNVRCEVWGWEDKVNADLIKAVDEFVPLSQDLIIGRRAFWNGEQAVA